MKFYLSLAAVAVLGMPVTAFADTEECRAQCQIAEEECSADAEQAIYDGEFSGHDCGDYNDCANVVYACRAETTTCEASCG